MVENLNLCMGCMNKADDKEVCSYCGYHKNNRYLPSYLPPATVLNDRYVVGKLLNYNGEGATYIGYDILTNNKIRIREFFPDSLCKRDSNGIAVIMLQNKLVQYKNLMTEFAELSKALSKMRSLSHINSVIEVFYANNTAYAVYEYFEGVTLKHYLQDKAGELSWDEVKKLFPPIFTTLSLIHNANIFHRGLSLDTIYFTDKNELIITGFCTSEARMAKSDISAEFFTGFTAPEQYNPNKWQGSFTDVYAVSAMLYRVMTGCMPTQALSRMGNDDLLEPSKINPSIPKNVSRAIMSGLNIDEKSRVQTITEFVTKLFDDNDFSQSMRVNSSTIIIPKQKAPGKKEEVKNKPLNSNKVFLIVLASSIAIVLLCAVIFAIINGISGTTKQTSANSYFNDSLLSVVESNDSEVLSSVEDSSSSSVVASQDVTNIQIPDLVNSKYDELNQFIFENFEVIVNYEYSTTYAKGIIISQDIKAGELIPVGAEITITVSNGNQYVTVPDFIGISEKEYIKTLDSLSIKYDTEYVDNAEFDDGLVCKTSKSVGEIIDLSQNQVLIVYVSKK